MKDKTMWVEYAHELPTTRRYVYSKLGLPADEHEVRDALQRARLTGRIDGFHEIVIEECPRVGLLTEIRLESPTLKELDFLARRLQSLDGYESLVYEALIDKLSEKGEPVSMKDLINCTYQLYDCPVAVNVDNDEKLGAFVIENEMLPEVNAVPEDSMELLDRKKIGEMCREMHGAVYNTKMCVFVDDYDMPEIYDGKWLPDEEAPTTWYAFRLLVGEPSKQDEATWIGLPMDKHDANRVAKKYGGCRIEDCVCHDFVSSVPQITQEEYGSMVHFDLLNDLAAMMAEMSPHEQVKFKAVLEAEKPVDVAGILDVAENLYQYELDTCVTSDGEFFKTYLARHMDSNFDTEWLKNLYVDADGGRLLRRLSAMVTDYGAISARGHSLYELVPYELENRTDQEPSSMEISL